MYRKRHGSIDKAPSPPVFPVTIPACQSKNQGGFRYPNRLFAGKVDSVSDHNGFDSTQPRTVEGTARPSAQLCPATLRNCDVSPGSSSVSPRIMSALYWLLMRVGPFWFQLNTAKTSQKHSRAVGTAIPNCAMKQMTLNVRHLGHALNDVGSIVGRDIDASKLLEATLYGFVKSFSPTLVRRGIHRGIASD